MVFGIKIMGIHTAIEGFFDAICVGSPIDRRFTLAFMFLLELISNHREVRSKVLSLDVRTLLVRS